MRWIQNNIYLNDARRALSSLVFLMPLIAAYEIGAAWIGPTGAVGETDQVIAYNLMRLFFSVLGATGVFLPGLLIIAILLVTHFLSGDPWKVRGSTLFGMLGESFLWTVPLLAVNRVIQYAALTTGEPSEWLENVVISTGAGVYEELVFRLVLVTAIVILLEDVLKLKKSHALTLAVIVSALLFAAHHHQPLGREPYEIGRFTFRTLAGMYLGALFLLRGYGITAGCHAVYNVIIVTQDALD